MHTYGVRTDRVQSLLHVSPMRCRASRSCSNAVSPQLQVLPLSVEWTARQWGLHPAVEAPHFASGEVFNEGVHVQALGLGKRDGMCKCVSVHARYIWVFAKSISVYERESCAWWLLIIG